MHFLPEGGGLEAFPVDAFVGPVHVADVTGAGPVIGATELRAARIPEDTERLLLKTSNSGWSRSATAFDETYVALDVNGARWCAGHGLRLVGIDYLSIEPFDPGERGAPVHRALLGEGIVILEGLELAGVAAGDYELAALPLHIPDGVDGAPARAVLLER